jgi:NAD(P)-dependent dehydrogenase (short-subunit alcohol dehydrogenase family)
MGLLDGKVAIITGAGRGLGREEALMFAQEGAKVLVNDLGVGHDGSGGGNIADDVVAEIKNLGGEAIANYDSVAEYDKAKLMIDQAIAEWGTLDIVVNNAGILRDKMIFNMTEKDWDLIMAVHLKGTFNFTSQFGAWLRQEFKAGRRNVKGRIINTSSDSGLYGNVGQSNYGAAKSGIATFTSIVAMELRKYATCNTVSPSAATRMTIDAVPEASPLRKAMTSSKNKSGLDIYDVKNFAPLVTFLASDKADDINGEVFRGIGDAVWIYRGWRVVKEIHNSGQRFTPAGLAEKFSELMTDVPEKPNNMKTFMSMFQR